MAMKRNITMAGRVARAVSGAICIGAGVACWLSGWPESSGWRWMLIGVTTMLGLFQVFEARKAWCVTRACGIKTPM